MALAERADLVARLTLDDRFSKPLGGVRKSFSGTVAAIAKGTAIGNLADRAISSGIRAFTGALRAGDASLRELEAVGLRTNAVIKSTGGVAGQTAEGIRKLAESYEDLSTNDDKAIQNTENLLLTFTNLRGEGFEPALKAVLNMNAALGGGDEGLQGNAIKVGRALQDPIKGLTALGRAGVSFSAAQQKQIRGLTTYGSTLGAVDKLGIKLTANQRKQLTVIDGTSSAAILLGKAGIKLTAAQVKQIDATAKANGVFAAQKIILGELDKEFGGQAEALGQGREADVKRLSDAVEDFQRTLAEGLAPAVDAARRGLTQLLRDPVILQSVKDLGKGISGLFTPEGIKGGISGVKSVIAGLKDVPWGVIGTSLKIGGAGAKLLFDAFNTMPDWVKTAVLTGWGLNKLTGGLVGSLASGLIKGVLGMTAGVVNINAGVVNGAGGVPSAAGAAAKGGLGLVSKVFLVGEAIGLAALVLNVQQGISEASTAQAKDIHTSLKDSLAGKPTVAELQTKLDAINTGLRDLASNPLTVFVAGDAFNELVAMRTEVTAELENMRTGVTAAILHPVTPQDQREHNRIMEQSGGETMAAVNAARDRIEAVRIATASGVDYLGDIAANTKLTKAQRLAELKFPFRIKHRVRSVDDLPDIGSPAHPGKHPERLGDPFGFRHLKSFAMGEVAPGGMSTELTRAIRDVETEIREAQRKGDPATVAKLQNTKEGLSILLGQVKDKTFEAGTKTYQGLLLAIAATDAVKGATDAVKGAIDSTKTATAAVKAALWASSDRETNRLVGALRNNRPIVNVSVAVTGSRIRVLKNYQSGRPNKGNGGGEMGGPGELN